MWNLLPACGGQWWGKQKGETQNIQMYNFHVMDTSIDIHSWTKAQTNNRFIDLLKNSGATRMDPAAEVHIGCRSSGSSTSSTDSSSSSAILSSGAATYANYKHTGSHGTVFSLDNLINNYEIHVLLTLPVFANNPYVVSSCPCILFSCCTTMVYLLL